MIRDLLSFFFSGPLGWLLGTVGIGGALLLLAVLFFGWPLIIGSKIGRIAVAVGAGVIGVFAILGRVRQQGAEAERQRHERENAEFLARQAERDRVITGKSDDQLDDILRERDRK